MKILGSVKYLFMCGELHRYSQAWSVYLIYSAQSLQQ